jgi:hypothetical protein
MGALTGFKVVMGGKSGSEDFHHLRQMWQRSKQFDYHQLKNRLI